ncbi:hypothetical protein LPB140_06285 [Sphingorhabdus lutea]|uniref:Leucine-binding protein domain-containing protein n=2 Tax=Sphingorhabdus lutea TaxID=1913578 RepID=A0A1L3JEU7_9SPHN|nr:hypothetical protein LPB140_06285 [Sphingorhabdus lutea]
MISNKYMNIIRKLSALMLISALAACQSVIPKGGQNPETTAPVAKRTTIVSNDAERHRVALLLPITGPDGDVGQAIANATALALQDTNDKSLRMTTYDTAGGAKQAAERAIADGNRLIIGPLRGDNVVEVASISKPANVPIITFSNDIGVASHDIFLLGHLPTQSVDRILRFAQNRGAKRFATIAPANLYGQRSTSAFLRTVRDIGAVAVTSQSYNEGTNELDAAVKKIASSGQIDAILIAANGAEAVKIADALRANGVKNAKFLGTDLWNISTRMASTKSLYGAWFATVSDGVFNDYAAGYKARYGTTPLRLTSLGYDSVLLTVRIAQDWPIYSEFPVDRLIEQGGFIGVDGAFRFMPDGLSERALEVQEVQNGQYVTIEAAPSTFNQR